VWFFKGDSSSHFLISVFSLPLLPFVLIQLVAVAFMREFTVLTSEPNVPYILRLHWPTHAHAPGSGK
jgi:hypothetical protein